MMRTVRLYGSLAEQFGSSFRLDVRSLAEACRALGAQLPGFRQAIEEGRFRVTLGRSRRTGWQLDKDLISFGLPEGDLHIVPVIRARKSGMSIGKIIVGTLIAVATWWMGGPAWLISMGAMVALQGVSSLLSPKKKTEKQKKSYMFQGADNVSEQGIPVPLIYGRAMVNPITISAGVTTANSTGLPTA
ncbi:tail assembly protein [Methylobacterium nodulans]|uniref:Lambda tail assembly I n=1 Tax=Methylobacterium nodulans (strain LMG 21967 / CNCM I-2342 / ORS 2060) TaxID=460265 RepID=B8IIL7_METNO|nr:tail assembly protein [Methylobacterium nodulans]ACL58937.1 lambda tail assembly I [Methylobacterium nodulans ORS 2060]ACL59894.1 lambda tail assembly I [Methylobacterium nodulans ORS 2060]